MVKFGTPLVLDMLRTLTLINQAHSHIFLWILYSRSLCHHPVLLQRRSSIEAWVRLQRPPVTISRLVHHP